MLDFLKILIQVQSVTTEFQQNRAKSSNRMKLSQQYIRRKNNSKSTVNSHAIVNTDLLQVPSFPELDKANLDFCAALYNILTKISLKVALQHQKI